MKILKLSNFESALHKIIFFLFLTKQSRNSQILKFEITKMKILKLSNFETWLKTISSRFTIC